MSSSSTSTNLPAENCNATKTGCAWDIETRPITSTWKQKSFALISLTAFINLLFYWAYFVYRVKCVLDVEISGVAPERLAGSWLLLAVECGMSIANALNNLFQCASLFVKQEPRLYLRGDTVPEVDVLITCCGEDVNIILDTVRAALAVNYPKSLVRVIILDDSHSLALAQSIGKLRKFIPNLYYTSREKGPIKDFKAGNLNHGIRYCACLSRSPAPIIAALDADMIPSREWLRTLVPHLLLDKKLALACPPQNFYNIPRNDVLQQNLDIFANVTERIKDSIGVAMCQGTGFIVRRSAALDVGCFPVSVSEDLNFSSLLNGAGWKTAYIQEPLQHGLVPESYLAHVKQRVRWGIGVFETAIKLNFYLFGRKCQKMDLVQRSILALAALLVLANIPLFICGLGLPIAFLRGYPLVIFSSLKELRVLTRLIFGTILSQYLLDCSIGLQAGFRVAMRESWYHTWMSPYMAIALIRQFFLPSLLGGEVIGFKPSGSLRDDLHERSATSRAKLSHRLYNTLWGCQAWIHSSYIVICVIGLGFVISRILQFDFVDGTASSLQVEEVKTNRLVYLLTHVAWPPVLLYTMMLSYLTPLIYTVLPPAVPPREEMMEWSEGIGRPKAEAKGVRFSKWDFGVEYHRTIIVLYSLVVFCLSWRI